MIDKYDVNSRYTVTPSKNLAKKAEIQLRTLCDLHPDGGGAVQKAALL